jgi:hypothetical protein
MRTTTGKIKIKDLLDSLENGEFTQDEIQRPGGIWSRQQKRCLIQTILRKDPYIGTLIFCVDRNNKITCLDGQQRLEAIKEFRDDTFGLNDVTISSLKKEGFDIKKTNQTYSSLTSIIQDRFNNMVVPIEWVCQKPEDSDDYFRERKNLWFQSINNGTSVKAHEKAVANAISKDVFPVQNLLRELNFLSISGFGDSLSGNGKPDNFFNHPNKGNDKFSWASLYNMVWIIKQINDGILDPIQSKISLVRGNSFIIPRTNNWISISSEYIKNFTEKVFNIFARDIEIAKNLLLRKGTPIPNKSTSTYDMRKTSCENLCIILANLLNIDIKKFPTYPTAEEIEVQRQLQNRSGLADIIIFTGELTTLLNQNLKVYSKSAK